MRGISEPLEADLAVMHVDLTVTPDDYRKVIERYPQVINGRVIDISKRFICRHRVILGDGYHGPVIIKTNSNSGGTREDILFGSRKLGACIRRVRAYLPWKWRSRFFTYPIFELPEQVPAAVWKNPELIVEQFLPEKCEGMFCLRTWVFLGDRESNSLSYSNEPVIKSSNVVKREQIEQVPDELRKMRAQLGFDYGKFDYSLIDGGVVLYDVNRTPTMGGLSRDQYRPRVLHLAEGIRGFL